MNSRSWIFLNLVDVSQYVYFLGGLGAGTKEDREEWQQRAIRFDNSVKNVVGLFEKLCACQNRELVYDLYTYVWDMCSVILTLNGFVQWLSRGVCSPKLQSYVVGQQTWFSGNVKTIVKFRARYDCQGVSYN